MVKIKRCRSWSSCSGQWVLRPLWATKAAESQAGNCMVGERPRQIDMPCRVRLDIYLVGYEGCRGEGRRAERQKERSEGKGRSGKKGVR